MTVLGSSSAVVMGENLLRTVPALSGFVHAERARADGLAQAERTVLALGECVLTEGLEHARYRVSADAFFQTSTGGALALYGAARELASLSPSDVVFDLYCGGGGIALFLAPGCARVLGLEANAAAVADAELNAKLNGVKTCRFMSECKSLLRDVLACRTVNKINRLVRDTIFHKYPEELNFFASLLDNDDLGG